LSDVACRTTVIDGIDLFYREAGPGDVRPRYCCTAGPASSHMFRDLIPKLADRFHLVAPDYPGFGFSARPTTFRYTFFPPAGAEAIGRDNPNATILSLEGGHFALEEHSARIAAEMRALADRIVAGVYAG
jgi:pimeloyl-ACP methyl ester carboxylesterase